MPFLNMKVSFFMTKINCCWFICPFNFSPFNVNLRLTALIYYYLFTNIGFTLNDLILKNVLISQHTKFSIYNLDFILMKYRTVHIIFNL